MRKKIRSILQIVGIFLLASCNREEITGSEELPSGDKIAVATEITVDGVELTTRAATEAGYTTGDGLYDKGDRVTVAAFANDGYELVKFYDKKYPSVNLGASHNLEALIPQTFKAEFARVQNYTISVSASPSAGGSVTGGGSYKGGTSCTVTATPNSGYVLDGWYESGAKVSSDASYTFTVSSNRTITAKFIIFGPFIMAGNTGSIITPSGEIKVGTNDWKNIAYGNGKYVIVGQDYNSGYITTSTDGVNWTTPAKSSYQWDKVVFGDGKFLAIENDYPTLNIAFSTDGVNWNTPISLRLGMSFTDIIYAEGKFVAVGTRNSSDAYSTASVDGITWTTPIPFGFVTTMDCLAYGNGNFVAGLDKSSVWFNSTNGVNWKKNGEISYMKDVIYAAGRFVRVGAATHIDYSIDGISWRGSDFFTNDRFDWFKILYNNNFLAIGKKKNDSSYYITVSTDGTKWIKPELLPDGAGNNVTKTINDMCIVY